MANHLQTKKRSRQTIKRTMRNRYFKSTMRNHVKNVRSLIQENDKDGAASALKLAVRSLDKAVTKGVLKRATASRTISRLTIAVNKIADAK